MHRLSPKSESVEALSLVFGYVFEPQIRPAIHHSEQTGGDGVVGRMGSAHDQGLIIHVKIPEEFASA